MIDRVDARILARLLAADFLPGVWRPDPATAAVRRQVLRRAHLVRQRTRLKNQVHAILHRNLVPRCPATDLFGHKGRAWLATQQLPGDELAAATALLRQLDFHAGELRLIEAELARVALERAEVLRLMTVPGIDATVAPSIVIVCGGRGRDVTRFRTPERLVAYLGLHPRVRQSGGQPASHGRITKAGSAHPRGMLVEAAWSAARTPGPLRASINGWRTGGVYRSRWWPPPACSKPAGGGVLASGEFRAGLRLCPAVVGGAQAAHARAACRRAVRPRIRG